MVPNAIGMANGIESCSLAGILFCISPCLFTGNTICPRKNPCRTSGNCLREAITANENTSPANITPSNTFGAHEKPTTAPTLPSNLTSAAPNQWIIQRGNIIPTIKTRPNNEPVRPCPSANSNPISGPIIQPDIVSQFGIFWC